MGPARSPKKELVQILEVSPSEADNISRIIMREQFDDPDSVYKRFSTVYNHLTGKHRDKIKALWYDQENSAVEIEGGSETIRHLKGRNYKIGIISNIWTPYYRAFEKACPEIVSMLDGITLSYKEGAEKPDIDLFYKALRSIAATPDKTAIIGDTYEDDLMPAMKLGMKTVWVLSRPEKEVEAITNVLNNIWKNPDHTVQNIKELIDRGIEWE